MSSKPAKPEAATDPLIPLFKSIGLNQAKAVEAAKSPKAAAVLKDLIEKHELAQNADEKKASLFAALASALSKVSSVATASQPEPAAGRPLIRCIQDATQPIRQGQHLESHLRSHLPIGRGRSSPLFRCVM